LLTSHVRKGLRKQGDHFGRNFAHYFTKLLKEILRSNQKIWATFGTIFSQTHLVTLVAQNFQMDGNIGCLVNGAGLAMATMDIIKLYGGDDLPSKTN
jgi:hypothetical protein